MAFEKVYEDFVFGCISGAIDSNEDTLNIDRMRGLYKYKTCLSRNLS